MSDFETSQLEYQHFQADLDRNGKRLIEGDIVLYKDHGYLFVEICPPLMLACIQTGAHEYDYVRPDELEVVT